MGTPTTYTYSISSDFTNHRVSLDRLNSEIRSSEIVTSLDSSSTYADDCFIVFKDPLSSSDELLLDGIIESHSGEPYPIIEPAFQHDRAQKVAIVGREGVEYIRATHDFCDATTWYPHSVRVTDEAMNDSGDGLTFTSPRPNWIDLYHGKVHEEIDTRQLVDHEYLVVVKVDDVEKVIRKPFAPSGGDYTIDYKTGRITFSISQAGKTVTVSYSYATDNEWVMTSRPGQVLELQYAEIQFTQDLDLKGAILMSYWIGDTMVGLIRYDTVLQIIYEAKGNNPVVKPFGGASRGLSNEMQIFPMTYMAVRRVFYDVDKAIEHSGATEVHFSILDYDDQPVECGGEAAVGTFYGVWRSEAECCS